MDIDVALEESAEALHLWSTVLSFPEVPAFSGGLMDAWPGWAVDALAVARAEEPVIRAVLAAEQRGKEKRNG